MNRKEARSILGVSRGASDSDVDGAFRDLAKEYHPDVCDAPGAQQKFKKLKEARKILKNTSQTKSTTSGATNTASTNTQSTTTTGRTTSSTSSHHTSRSQSTQSTSATHSTSRNQKSSSSSKSWRDRRAKWEEKSGRATHSNGESTNSESSQQTSSASVSGNWNIRDHLTLGHLKTTVRTAVRRIKNERSGGWVDNPENLQTGRQGNQNLLTKSIVFYLLCVFESFRPSYPSDLRHTQLNPFADLLSVWISIPDKLHSIGKNAIRKYALVSVGLGVTLAAAVGTITSYGTWGHLAAVAFGATFIAASLNIIMANRVAPFSSRLADLTEHKLNCWSPLGSVLMLGVFGGFYTFAQIFEDSLLLIPSIQMFPILLLYSLPAIGALTFLLRRTQNLPHSGFSSRLPNSIPIGLGMVITGLAIHLPIFHPVMPGYFIGLDSIYSGTGIEIDGIIISIASTLWLCLFVPSIDAIETGWNRVHRDWQNNTLARIIATGTISGGIAVILWTILPSTPLPADLIATFEYMVLVLGVYLYTYGIMTTPNEAPNWN